jgi:lipid-A-disaccharide synthase
VRRERGLPAEGRLVGLFPGSRRTEIAYHLPLQIEAFLRLRRLAREPEGLAAAIGLAPGIEAGDVRRVGGALLEQAGTAIRLVETRDGSLFDALDVALVKPGTVTLEATLRDCPMVVVGRVHRVSAWLARRSVRVAWVALPNLVAGRAIVPELLQEAARPETVAAALAELLEGPAREAQLAGLAEVVQALGPPGAITAVAARVEEMLGTPRA